MLYIDHVKTITSCPFCDDIGSQTIRENDRARLVCALAPYSAYHLLVVPKRHVVDYLELVEDELDAIHSLVRDGIQSFKALGLTDYSVMVRNGDKQNIGKSVDHLHFHIVPKVRLGMIDANGDERVVLAPEEIARIVDRIKRLDIGGF